MTADTPRTARKRSRHVALLLAGAAAMGVSACQDDKTDARAFPDLQSCVAAVKDDGVWFSEDDCRTQFAAAEQEHLQTAPRYQSKELCEQEHGAGACGEDPAAQAPGAQQNQGGGFSFMPLFMGYMIGSMLGGRGGVFSQPLIRTPQGYATPGGGQTFTSNRGSARVPTSTFTRAPTTLGKTPMTPAQVTQRGGFGAARTAAPSGSLGGGRSYGG